MAIPAVPNANSAWGFCDLQGRKNDYGFFDTVVAIRTHTHRSSGILTKRFLFRKPLADLLVYPIGSFCHSRVQKLSCLASGNEHFRLPLYLRCDRLQAGALLDYVQTIQVVGSTGDCRQPERLHSVQHSLRRALDGTLEPSHELQVGPRLRSWNGSGGVRCVQPSRGDGRYPFHFERMLRLRSRRASCRG